jgi:predicted ester cyclase
VVNGRRLKVLDQLVAPNYKRYVAPTAAPLNLEGHKQRLAGFFAVFPDLLCTIEELIAEGDRLAWRNTCRSTHLGRGLLGLAPTGKRIEVGEFMFARIERGKFVELWGGPDTWLVLQQLGAQVTVPTAP